MPTKDPACHTTASAAELNAVATEFSGVFRQSCERLEEIFRKLDGRLCPLQSVPEADCLSCVRRHPRHYPRGLTDAMRKILEELSRNMKVLREAIVRQTESA